MIALLVFIWGSTWLVIKIGLADLPPFLLAGVRFALGAAILFVVAKVQGIVSIPRSARLHAALFALGAGSFSVNYGVVYWSEQYLPSGLTAVLFATYPFFTLLVAHLIIPGERITARKMIGVALGFLGVALIFRTDLTVAHPLGLTAAMVLLVSPVVAAFFTVAVKRWGSQIHPYTLTTLPMTYGALTLLTVSLMTEDIQSARWSATAVGSVVYLAIFGSVIGFVVYYTLLRKVAVTSLNLIAYLFPVVAVVLGYLVLDEVLEPLTFVGAGAIVIGIVIATYRRRVPGGGGSLSQPAGSDSASHLTASNTVRQPRQ